MKKNWNRLQLAIATITVATVLSACGTEQEREYDREKAKETNKESIQEETNDEPSVQAESVQKESLYDQVGGKLYIGDEFKLGTYEQDNNLDNGPEDIEWVVFEKINDNEYLCISKYVLDAQVFCEKNTATIPNKWSTSTIRKWLNNDFYNTAFTDYEKNTITEMSTRYHTWKTYLENGVEDSLYYDTTQDMVRLLNYGEFKTFPGCVKVTEYAKSKGAPYCGDGTREHDDCSTGWFLMTFRKSIGTSKGYSGDNIWRYYKVGAYLHSAPNWAGCDEYGVDELSNADVLGGVRPVIAVKLTKE